MAGRYPRALLSKALYWHAFPLFAIIAFFHPDHFRADDELVEEIQSLKTLEEIRFVLDLFRHDSRNQTFSRHVLKLRISTRRLDRIASRILARDAMKAQARRTGPKA